MKGDIVFVISGQIFHYCCVDKDRILLHIGHPEIYHDFHGCLWGSLAIQGKCKVAIAIDVYVCCVPKVWQGDESGAFHRCGEAVESELQPSDSQRGDAGRRAAARGRLCPRLVADFHGRHSLPPHRQPGK